MTSKSLKDYYTVFTEKKKTRYPLFHIIGWVSVECDRSMSKQYAHEMHNLLNEYYLSIKILFMI